MDLFPSYESVGQTIRSTGMPFCTTTTVWSHPIEDRTNRTTGLCSFDPPRFPRPNLRVSRNEPNRSPSLHAGRIPGVGGNFLGTNRTVRPPSMPDESRGIHVGRDESRGTRVSEGGSAVARCGMRAARAALISKRFATPRRVRAAMASGKDKADVQVDESLGLELVALENERGVGLIVGMAHFIKSVEDLQEALAGSVPNARFGVGFCEASGDRLVRWDGNVKDLAKLARDYAMHINCGHAFVCCVENCFPIHVLNAIKAVPEVATVYCATNNPVMIVVANATSKFHTGRGIMGVVDGRACVGVEEQEQQAGRRQLLQDVGLKFGPNYEK